MRTAAAIALLLLAGCPSVTVYRTADPVAPGRWQLHGAMGAGALRDGQQETRIPTGHLELGARRGLTTDLDVGGKLYTYGAEASATWRFARTGAWSLAAAPALGGTRTIETGITTDAIHLHAAAALIASRPLSRCWTLALGPTAGWGLYWPETGGHAQGLWLGGFALADRRLGRRWHLSPELGLFRVVAGQVPVDGGWLHLGLGVRVDL